MSQTQYPIEYTESSSAYSQNTQSQTPHFLKF